MRWRQAGSRPREVALDEAPEPAARDDEQPDVDEVLTALAELSFNQRAAIVMRELEGRSYQEISGVLGVSVSAVEALLFRGRRNLKLKRGGLGVLTTVPLPGSLASFIGGGGGVVAAGGAAFGADLVLKAAAVVAVGAATAGAGFKSVQAMTAPHKPVRAQAVFHNAAAKPHQAAAQTAGTNASGGAGDCGPPADDAQARRCRAGRGPRLAPDRRRVRLAAGIPDDNGSATAAGRDFAARCSAASSAAAPAAAPREYPAAAAAAATTASAATTRRFRRSRHRLRSRRRRPFRRRRCSP